MTKFSLYDTSPSSAPPTSAWKPPTFASGIKVGGSYSPEAYQDVGKFNIDLTDPVGSTVQNVQSFAGLVGQIGIPGGPNLGGVGEVAGGIATGLLGAAGEAGIPGGPLVKDVVGAAGEALALGQRAAERTAAGFRVQAGKGDLLSAAITGFLQGNPVTQAILGLTEGRLGVDFELPPDLQQRLDSGESVDSIADALVERGQGYTSNQLANLHLSVVYDPLNFVAPAVGKAHTVGRVAATSSMTARELGAIGVPLSLYGKAFNTASAGLGRAGAATMDRALGPVTSGIFHSLGIAPYKSLRGKFGSVGLSSELDDALGVANGNIEIAVMVRRFMHDVDRGLARVDELPDFAAEIRGMTRVQRRELQREAEHLMDRHFSPTLFDNIADPVDWAARRIVAITRNKISYEDARRLIGKKPSRDTLRTLDLAAYGRMGDDLAKAVADSRGIEGAYEAIARLDDITILSHHTLTDVRLDDLRSALDGLVEGVSPMDAAVDAVARYDDLFDLERIKPDDLIAAVRKRLDNIKDRVPHQIKPPKTGESPLPAPLSEARQRLNELGYEIGFGPESGWKVIETADGGVVPLRPFVPFTSTRAPVEVRNRIGRVYDQMFRGVEQQKLIHVARRRMIDIGRRKAGMSEQESRAFFRAVLNRALDTSSTPRGVGVALRIDEYKYILRDTVGKERAAAIAQKYDPTTLVYKAFENDLRVVGWSQKFSGIVKTKFPQAVGGLTEVIYPLGKFVFSPGFRAQERIESGFWNLLRGATRNGWTDEAIDSLYGKLLELNPDLLILDGGERYARLAKALENTPGYDVFDKILSRSAVAASKERGMIAQIVSEHPDRFRQMMVDMGGKKLIDTFEEAYGTTNWRVIAEKFMEERAPFTFAEDLPDALKRIDAIKPRFMEALGEGAYGLPEGFVAEEGFAYHITRSKALDYIAKEGVQPRTAPGGATEALSYWGRRPRTGWARTDDSLILRTRDDILEPAAGGVDAPNNLVARATVPAERVEYFGADGAWHPVRELVEGPKASFADDLGQKPSIGAPADGLSQEEKLAYYAEKRAAQAEWYEQAGYGLATGQLEPSDIERLGGSLGLMDSRRGDTIANLPDTLYHATTARSDVLRSGLRTRDELGGTSALGGGASNTISFTTDRAVADRIEAVMREAVDILNGRITMDDLVARAKANPDHWRELTKVMTEEKIEKLRSGLKYEFRSTSPIPVSEMPAGSIPDEATKIVGGDGVARYAGWDRPMAAAERTEEVFDFYRGPFNLTQEVAGGPMDPLFFSPDVNYLRGLDPADIGVIEARPIAGAKGHQVSSLGEWRTWSGDAVDIVGGRKAPPLRKPAERAGPAVAPATMTPSGISRADLETAWNGFRYSFEQAEKQAFKTHLFNPERGWFERSLNHPYLGLYPLSYMWGKVVPEMARFLLRRPFGLDAPLVGLAAAERLQSGAIAMIAADPELQDFLSEHEETIYALQLLVPGTPYESPVNTPAWGRHLSRDTLQGRRTNLPQYLSNVPGDTISYIGGFRDFRVGGDVVGELGADLEKAASAFDGIFGQ